MILDFPHIFTGSHVVPAQDSALTRFVKEFATDLAPLHTNYFIAGGSARRMYTGDEMDGADIDLFFESMRDYEVVADKLKKYAVGTHHKNCQSFLLHSENTKYKTIAEVSGKDRMTGKNGVNIQLIYSSWFNSMETLLENFDFTVCQIAFWEGELWCSPATKNHLDNKILSIQPKFEEAKTRFKYSRFLKYIRYGYTPDDNLFNYAFINGREELYQNTLHNSQDDWSDV